MGHIPLSWGSTAACVCMAMVLFPAKATGQVQLPQVEPAQPHITVTGRRGTIPQEPDAVQALQSLCFDPSRRTGRPREPETLSRWLPLEAAERRQFGITDDATAAVELHDASRRHELWLKIEELHHQGGLVEHRCTMLVVGGTNHERFVGDLTALFGGPPTQRHIGHEHGTPRLSGWRQWLWTGMPQRGSSTWRSAPGQRRAGGSSWIVVTDSNFWTSYDYIYGDLKTTADLPSLSMITFAVVRKGRSSRRSTTNRGSTGEVTPQR